MTRVRRLVDRGFRGYADLRRVAARAGSAAPATGLVGDVSRSDLEEWTRATRAAHLRLRKALEPAAGSIAVVCVSIRPALLEDVVRHVVAQQGGLERAPEVVFVANSTDFDPAGVTSAFADVPGAQIITPPEPLPLGAALNAAMARTDARFIAKFDDDDRYGPHHLADSLRAHTFAGAGVVGKHSYVAELVGLERLVVRYPGNEYRYSSALAGGTLVIDRDRTSDLRFEEISLGEDQAFLRACHRRGISTFAADRHNFVQVRHSSNTWEVDEAIFAADSVACDDLIGEVLR